MSCFHIEGQSLQNIYFKSQKEAVAISCSLIIDKFSVFVVLWVFQDCVGYLSLDIAFNSTFCPSKYYLRSWTIVILVRNTKLILLCVCVFFKQLFLPSSLVAEGGWDSLGS